MSRIILLITAIFLAQLSFAAQRNIIIKLKQNTPQEVINNFKNNNPKSGNNSLSVLCRNLNIKSSEEAFKKMNDYFADNAQYEQSGLGRIFVLNIDEKNLEQLINLGNKNEYIEYIQGNNRLKIETGADANFTPNDSYFNSQYYLNLIGMNNVWDITTGDSNVVIGVVDTGLDFLHPDLQKCFKINYGEYGNGKESNGIDDDANGYTDDWRGWDFTDEPLTGDPGRGDYLDQDNDPADDNLVSHGTAVTGIITASFNNNLGISSVAPNCKVLVMRAFDAQGLGEEDDVANAILYGVSRGVRIFNFSFGDYVFSNLLRDVIKFAYSKNVFIVCSAGNDSKDGLHYPSAYDEVISVGASDQTDFKVSNSSFGETVDLFAPGFQNLTTVRKGTGNSTFNFDYEKLSGTSMAAPVVSGVAALILSRNPALTNEELRGILVSSTTLMANQSGWDHNHSSGRLNALTSVENYDKPAIVRINYPYQDFTFESNEVPVCISAASPLFLSYSIFYGVGERPTSWIPIVQNQTSQVLNDTVALWNTSSLPDTSYTLRLAINSNSGRTIEHRMIIFKDRNPPAFTFVNFGNIIDKDNYSELILFATNKRTLGKIYYKRKNVTEPFQVMLADVGTPNIGYVTNAHFGLLSSDALSPNTEYEFYLEATSLNGKTIVKSDTSFYFYTQPQINSYGYIQKNFSLPYSQPCNAIADVNNNGLKDIFINIFSQDSRLELFEFTNGNFNKISNGNWGDFKFARDVADNDGDGNYELLASKGRNGYIYESSASNQIPSSLAWSDTLSNNFWSSRFADVTGDGVNELIGLGNSGVRILQPSGSNSYSTFANLSYFGENGIELPSQIVLVEDFDSDGRKDVFFVNYHEPPGQESPLISMSLYENSSGNNFNRIVLDDSIRRKINDNISIASGDFIGNGKKEFAVGTVSLDFDLVQYYSIAVYKATGNDDYAIMDVIDIYNYKSYLETSLRSGDIDNDGTDEILVNSGSLFYIFKYDNNAGRFLPVFYKKDINTVNQIIYDFDGNGVKEIGLNTTDDTLLFFEKEISFTGPATPLNLRGYSIDSNQIRLNFESVANADYYRIYRSDTTINFILIDSSVSNEFSDVSVVNRKNYYYKVSAVDEQNTVRESHQTNAIGVYCHNKSRMVSAHTENNGYVSVKFSEKISTTIPNMNTFIVSNGIGYPKNISVKSNFEYLLIFDSTLQNGNYSLKSSGLTDLYNSPVDTNSAVFTVYQEDSAKFYISNLALVEKYKLKVEFNLDADSASSLNPANYKFEPFNIAIKNVSMDNANKKIVYINLDNKAVIGATGKNYLLRAGNIYSEDGIKIVDGAGSSFGLIFNKENLEEMYVYPNPFSISSNQDYITFANITREASINIYDITGKFIISIEESNGNGGVEWDMKDGNGNDVSTGIYLFRATGKNSDGTDVEEKLGKFAIVR